MNSILHFLWQVHIQQAEFWLYTHVVTRSTSSEEHSAVCWRVHVQEGAFRCINFVSLEVHLVKSFLLFCSASTYPAMCIWLYELCITRSTSSEELSSLCWASIYPALCIWLYEHCTTRSTSSEEHYHSGVLLTSTFQQGAFDFLSFSCISLLNIIYNIESYMYTLKVNKKFHSYCFVFT